MCTIEEIYSLKRSIDLYAKFLKNFNKHKELFDLISDNIGRPVTKQMIKRDIALIDNIKQFLTRDFNINDIEDIRIFLESFVNRGSFATFIYPFIRRMYVFLKIKENFPLLDPVNFREFTNNLITEVSGIIDDSKYISNIEEIQQIMDMIDEQILNNVEKKILQHSLAIFLIFGARKHDVYLPRFRNDCFFYFLNKKDKEDELLVITSTTFWKKFSKYICGGNENFILNIKNSYFLRINSILEKKFFKYFNITFKTLRRTAVNYKYFELLEKYKFNNDCVDLAIDGIMDFLKCSKRGLQHSYLYSFEEYKQIIENDIKKEI